MSYTEYPALTDAEEIKKRLGDIETTLASVIERLDGHATGINSIGENLQWVVNSVQGVMGMFSSPQFMSQMMNQVMGGMVNGGATDPAEQ